jgi:hypothetical protein
MIVTGSWNPSITTRFLTPTTSGVPAMAPRPPVEEPTSERFEYFLIRVTRSDKDPGRLAGLVERLG